LESGLFYLAPGAGFLIGSTIGGKISDQAVKYYKKKRNGQRLPEDRLNSSLPSILVVLPLGTLLYGWSVQNKIGGMALPIVASFTQGVGLMASFSALNTYSAGKSVRTIVSWPVLTFCRSTTSLQDSGHHWKICCPIQLCCRQRWRRCAND
jgi:MFS family permease